MTCESGQNTELSPGGRILRDWRLSLGKTDGRNTVFRDEKGMPHGRGCQQHPPHGTRNSATLQWEKWRMAMLLSPHSVCGSLLRLRTLCRELRCLTGGGKSKNKPKPLRTVRLPQGGTLWHRGRGGSEQTDPDWLLPPWPQGAAASHCPTRVGPGSTGTGWRLIMVLRMEGQRGVSVEGRSLGCLAWL